MKKILIKSTLKILAIFLLIFLLNIFTYYFWKSKLTQLTFQIKEIIKENKKNENIIAHYSQLLNERELVKNDFEKLKSLFFTPDDIFRLKEKIGGLAIMFNLFIQFQYQIIENQKEIKFSIVIPSEGEWPTLTNNLIRFLKALEKKYLVKIEKIDFNNSAFTFYGTFYLLP